MKKGAYAGILVVTGMAGLSIYVYQHNRIESPRMVTGAPTAASQQASQPTGASQLPVFQETADFIKVYNDIGDLASHSDIIVTGTVLRTSSFDYYPVGADDAVVYTSVTVKVERVWKGAVKAGDIVTFVEPGGTTTAKAMGLDKKWNLPPERWNEPVRVVFNGIPPMQAGQHVLLFGHTPDKAFQSMLNEPFYNVLGANQGKFTIREGIVERPVPGTSGVPEYSPLNMTLARAEELIQTSLSTP
ncbi:MAG: hypothetical protein IRZ10_11080 [Thermoflavifilum sp.]|nr:hypothetical protein [Thermoflavifilum sp.]MCL6514949.1 hypothetical protein [Alicyclobacillus sp.]